MRERIERKIETTQCPEHINPMFFGASRIIEHGVLYNHAKKETTYVCSKIGCRYMCECVIEENIC